MLVPLVVYVDVDDTLVRTAGSKRIPVSGVTEHVRALAAAGAELYCWSAGGGPYARSVAEGLGIAECFKDFLPKPQVLIDDVALAKWNRLLEVHPAQCGRWTALSYQRVIAGEILDSEQGAAAVTAAKGQ
jgi:phosphoglycolate phosphatase-like HAD superfamily hydrolase